MTKIKRMPLTVFGVFLAAGLLAFSVQFLIKAGAFKSADEFREGIHVEHLPTAPGIEDLDFDPETGTIFLSAHDRRRRESTGAIYAMDSHTHEIRNLTAHLKLTEFRPHGISFLAYQGKKYLFVISHRDSKHVVIKFKFQNDSLFLDKTFSSTDFSSPNDLLAVGENAFFVTNDHGTVQGWKKVVTDYLQLPVGNVVFYDGQRSGVVLKRISYPNGLAYFNERLYIASTLGKYIGVYQPISSHYQLKEERKIKVPDAPDNLMVFGNRIYFASHPKLLAFAAHARDSLSESPSSVYYLEENLPYLVYMGKAISGSSTALPVPDSSGRMHLYVGSVYTEGILRLGPVE